MRGLGTLALCVRLCLAYNNRDIRWDLKSDDDLHTFVSRPDLRPPRFAVDTVRPDALSSGYVFVAPYVDLKERFPTSAYQPGQTGPHIYDTQGGLIWSGAHLFGSRPTFDFKVQNCNDQACLTFILNEDLYRKDEYVGGAGIILDSSFNIRDTVAPTVGRGTMNMHEFLITEDKTALFVTYTPTLHRMTNDIAGSENILGNNGFAEVDVKTGKTIFEWWPLDHLEAIESEVMKPKAAMSYDRPWDFFHMNSIEKLDDGDYLISARHMDTIYKISGVDGEIVWRLGGRLSSFKQQNFNFSRQHDARVHSANSTTIILSFFNNAADDNTRSAQYSSAMLVALDLPSMTATMLKHWDRPDHRLSHLRGNTQILPNGNVFVGWSENAVISEFSEDGELLLSARWMTERFDTYRAYKFDFTGAPNEDPALAINTYGTTPDTAITMMYVSWNGATEVASWRFYDADAKDEARPGRHLGEVARTSFETSLTVNGYVQNGIAVAVARNGSVIGHSSIVRSKAPEAWEPVSPALDDGSSAIGSEESSASSSSISGSSSVLEQGESDTLASTTIESSAAALSGYVPSQVEPQSFTVGLVTAVCIWLCWLVLRHTWRRISRRHAVVSLDVKYERLPLVV